MKKSSRFRQDLLIAGSEVLVAGIFFGGTFSAAFNRLVEAVSLGLGRHALLFPWVYAWVATSFIRSRRVGLLAVLLVFCESVASSAGKELDVIHLVSLGRHSSPFSLSLDPVGSILLEAAEANLIELIFCGFWAIVHPRQIRTFPPSP